jgi:hypothetical protein
VASTTNTKSEADRAALAELHRSIAERAAAVGLSRLALARASAVSYTRIITGQPLDSVEVAAIEGALASRERAREELAAVSRRVLRETLGEGSVP